MAVNCCCVKAMNISLDKDKVIFLIEEEHKDRQKGASYFWYL